MRRKQEDELIKLAFGDEDGDSSRAQPLIREDEESAKLFAGYEDLRQGLKQLSGAVPDHQLSSERLREAILRRGLKEEKKRGFDWRVALAPTAVMACAFLITLRLSDDPNVRPEGIASISSLTERPGDESIGIEAEPPPIEFTSTDRESARIPSQPKPSVSVVPSPNSTPSERSLDTRELVASNSQARSRTGSNSPAFDSAPLSPAEISNLAIDGALPAGAVAMVDGALDETPLVIIGSDIDDETGAKRATEVSSTSNVLIGG